jgi:hypothetical protein
MTWSGSGGGSACAGSLAGAGHGSFSTVNNSILNKRGSARYDCNNGVWSLGAGSVCYDYCIATSSVAGQAPVGYAAGEHSTSGYEGATRWQGSTMQRCLAPGFNWVVIGGTPPVNGCPYGAWTYGQGTCGYASGRAYVCITTSAGGTNNFVDVTGTASAQNCALY